MNCEQCGKEIVKPTDSFTTGYGIDENGRKICYECCAKQDESWMNEHGKITLYFTGNNITNWPGSLSFKALYVKKSFHNIAGYVNFVTFKDHNGKLWYGRQYGAWSDICHCKRYKG